MPAQIKLRGPKRTRKDDGSRVVTIKFRPQEYAKLKCLSVDQDRPLRELVFEAVRKAYGDTTPEEMNRTFGTPPLKTEAKVIERIEQSWTFSADTITGPAPVPLPAKSSSIPRLKVPAPSLTELSGELWKMLQK